jgi:hypothetical protein
MELIEGMYEALCNTPADELVKGYRLTPPTRRDLLRAISLLEKASRHLQRAEEREDLIYNTYCECLEAGGVKID